MKRKNKIESTVNDLDTQGLAPPIFIAAPPQYFPGCFPLAFLEGHCPFSSPVVISLCLDPVIWNSSAPSNRAASSSNTSSQSCWRYSIILFFLFSSSATLCLLASSLALASTSLLAFWAMHSAWCNFVTSSSWARSCYCFSCFHCISYCCFSRTSASFCQMLERAGENIMI